ncbi:MAG: YihY/virulence factor BrkB family protein [Muribaculum sp.]|nr:YihY/virulence factor BrkB family protein [Muribaculaceae bacterium]MCM1080638.1 YihY/virulence factor BrkB family protein [Muribaculum sp.]
MIAHIGDLYKYCTEGVWNDTRQKFSVNMIKTLNLSVRSFLNSDLQNRASALTYSTLLSLVPALAMLFAIGRGFGFQNMLQSQLFKSFPAQTDAINKALSFVDSYLSQASQGIFVGVGLAVLLWTLISLMSNVEESFNKIWCVSENRPIARKIVDYTAIMFLLPVLMICSSGMAIFLSTAFIDNPRFGFISPAMKVLLDCAPFLLTWIAFTCMYLIFPNTRVKFKNALVSGILAGTAFQILQLLFVTGQIYVSKYNAIYGSFALLPLLLIWLQLVWTITLAGCVLCYSSQNIFQFNFSNDISSISLNYRRKIAMAIMAVIVRRFDCGLPPLGIAGFASVYHLPARLVTELIGEMSEAGLVSVVLIKENGIEAKAFQPAVAINELTLGYVLDKLNNQGADNFVPDFDSKFAGVLDKVDLCLKYAVDLGSRTLLKDIPLAMVHDDAIEHTKGDV